MVTVLLLFGSPETCKEYLWSLLFIGQLPYSNLWCCRFKVASQSPGSISRRSFVLSHCNIVFFGMWFMVSYMPSGMVQTIIIPLLLSIVLRLRPHPSYVNWSSIVFKALPNGWHQRLLKLTFNISSFPFEILTMFDESLLPFCSIDGLLKPPYAIW